MEYSHNIAFCHLPANAQSGFPFTRPEEICPQIHVIDQFSWGFPPIEEAFSGYEADQEIAMGEVANFDSMEALIADLG